MTWVALGSAGESNTLTMPPFSPTNTLPPGAKAMAVGRFSPLHTALSENPVGTAAVTAGDVGAAERVAGPRTSPPRPPAADAGPAASREARRTTSEPPRTRSGLLFGPGWTAPAAQSRRIPPPSRAESGSTRPCRRRRPLSAPWSTRPIGRQNVRTAYLPYVAASSDQVREARSRAQPPRQSRHRLDDAAHRLGLRAPARPLPRRAASRASRIRATYEEDGALRGGSSGEGPRLSCANHPANLATHSLQMKISVIMAKVLGSLTGYSAP